MHLHHFTRAASVILAVLLLSTTALAQWLDCPTPGVPRLPDGKPDLVRARAEDSGWQAGPVRHMVRCRSIVPLRHRAGPGHEGHSPLGRGALHPARARCTDGQPALEVPAGQRSVPRLLQPHAHRPDAGTCRDALRVSQRAAADCLHRRPRCAEDPNPTWFGYSVGRWEGDTLVITSAGFNDQGWLDSSGHPQTETLRLTERLRRRDFGHMDYEITVNNPKVFTRPFTIERERLLSPDTQLLEASVRTSAPRPHVRRYRRQVAPGTSGAARRRV